ncbi:RNA polymerase II transcription factor B subunit 1 [Coemansia sp. RSA 2703]|nr:RNA polymerase II transcription factor B subunit 1 [Coemansia sp. RSA 2703]KAJ2376557.1 RNA polymerase II transcription factor B subunit 1 [Coemansia sp. RSA 2607]KAJ2397765.1 RNA polymerase II transcription factor B subunit 1 [Coemansia sp. RSA 2603]
MLLIPGEVVNNSSETIYNREEGTLFITNKRLAWCQAGSEIPTCEMLYENFCSQQVSKADSKKVMLRINALSPGSAPDSQPIIMTFNWKNPNKEAAIADRDKYVNILGAVTPRRPQAPGATASGAASTGTGQSAGATPANTGAPGSNAKAPGASAGAPSGTAAGRASGSQENSEFGRVNIGKVPASAEEIKIRQEVLSKNEDLAKLHKTLVIAGLISEDEFWSTRKHILETQAIQMQLRKGSSSTWLDLAPNTQASGDFRYVITPNVARRIFKEFPQVKKAYVANVPHKVAEKEFWKRFVASQFFNRGRTADGSRGSRDAIFDECTVEEDAMFGNTNRYNLEYLTSLLDLTRTQEDSVETGNAPDFTMRPSSVDNKLPLFRRFNHHSELVLQSVLNSKRKNIEVDHITADKELRNATVLEDLEIPEPEKKIKLSIQDRSRYFTNMSNRGSDGQTDTNTQSTGPMDVDSVRAALKVSFNISRSINGYGDTQKTIAILSRSAHMVAMQKRPNRIQELNIPNELMVAVAECHGAGTEMLRHMWSLMRLPYTNERFQRGKKIVEAFDNVQQRIRETIAKANTMESKNPKLGSTVEKMLQPITKSLEKCKKAFNERGVVKVTR